MNTARTPYSRVEIEPIEPECSLESVVVSFAQTTGPAILESSLFSTGYGRFSIFACDPVEVLEMPPSASTCPFSGLSKRINECGLAVSTGPQLPFNGGWIGFVSYEAGLAAERITPTTCPDLPLPAARFGLYDSAAIYDHSARQWYVLAVDWPPEIARRRPPVTKRLAAMRQRLETAAENFTPLGDQRITTAPPVSNMDYPSYRLRVERAKRYIEAGDIYQVNLTQRFTARTNSSPVELYCRLRRMNPSSHAAFILWDNVAILSASPELFLALDNGHVVTRPIKGTRPRTGEPRADASYRSELINSEKDRAELTMIVDLLRNDLGRVCSYGSVRVTEAGGIEEHPTVFHRVATIEGDLAPGKNWLDLARAAFPGGSVTGAPKIRAMQIIDELEPTHRGVYCGSIGWIGLDGSMCLNIAIRTMVQIDDVVHFYAGGAIVADSTPEEEYNEILAKSAGMLRALNVGGRVESPGRVEVATA